MIIPVLMTATPTPAPAADVDRQLADVQAEIKTLEDRVDVLQTQRASGRQECARLVARCNGIHGELQPLLESEGKLIKWNNVARYAGLGSGGALGLGPGLMSFSPIAGMAVFGATVVVIAAAFIGTEYTRKKLREIRPEINGMVQSWKWSESQLRREEADVSRLSGDILRLEPSLKSAKGREEVLLVARGVTRPPEAGARVKDEEDSVVIGQLRVPKRAKGAEDFKVR